MSKELSFLQKHLIFICGQIENQERLVFIAHLHEALEKKAYISQIMILEKGEKWSDGGRYKFQGVSIFPLGDKEQTIIALGRDGEVVTINLSGSQKSRIEVPGKVIGPLKGLRRIGDSLFAYGMRRQIFRLIGQNQWVLCDKGFPYLNKSEDPDDRLARIRRITDGMGSIEAIAGHNAEDFYAVGIKGEIWHYDGNSWLAEDSPTNHNLYDITLSPDGDYYICGQKGIVLKGRNKRWEPIEFIGSGEPDFYSVGWFNERLYVADGESLQVLKDDTLELVDLGEPEVVPSHQIHVNDSMLLSVAGKEVYLTADGKNWNFLL